MRTGYVRRAAAEVALMLGTSFTILGIGVLIAQAGGGSRAAALPASLFVIVGALFAFVAVRLHRRAKYFFIAAFLIQVGFLLLLMAADAVVAPLSRIWPVFSIFAGLALIPAGFSRYGTVRSRFIVPTLVFISLGVFFLLFSFRLVPFSFKRFILDWWPLLLVLAGVILTLVSLGSRGSAEEPPS